MKKLWFLLLLLFTVFVGFYFFFGWSHLPDGHRYIYILDDVYIHLSISKNFAESSAWSVNPVGFDSASSSILYTLLLSFFIKLFGDWEYYPLLINVCFGYMTIYSFYRYFKDFYGISELIWAIILLLPFTMLYLMVLIGMEHTIHLFLMVLAVYFIHKNANSNFTDKSDFTALLFIVFFLATVRFESMFFTVSLAFALFLRKEFYKGILIFIFGAIPVLIFGYISILKGGYFFPNSVMIKGSYPAGNHFLVNMWQFFEDGILLNPSFYKCLFFPYILGGLYLIRKYRATSFKKSFFINEILIITIFSTSFLHAMFSVLKYRYENYLMIAILMIIAPMIANFFGNLKKEKLSIISVSSIGCIIFIFLAAIYRLGFHHNYLSFSSKGINEQQVEMSRFLGQYYRGEKVVANDIGAIAYFSHVQLLDIVGLGSTDIAKNIIENKSQLPEKFTLIQNRFITQYVIEHDYKVAVIYPGWFPGKIPANWIPVASWSISENSFGPARKTVVFYALSNKEVLPLKQNLQKFNINKNVKQIYFQPID